LSTHFPHVIDFDGRISEKDFAGLAQSPDAAVDFCSIAPMRTYHELYVALPRKMM
jgi:hypothetical protein